MFSMFHRPVCLRRKTKAQARQTLLCMLLHTWWMAWCPSRQSVKSNQYRDDWHCPGTTMIRYIEEMLIKVFWTTTFSFAPSPLLRLGPSTSTAISIILVWISRSHGDLYRRALRAAEATAAKWLLCPETRGKCKLNLDISFNVSYLFLCLTLT